VGSMAAAFLAGMLIGPPVAGAIFDSAGSYEMAFYGFAVCCLVAAALHATVTLRLGKAATDL
jgi:cyanate permease